MYSVDDISGSGVFLRKPEIYEYVLLGFLHKFEKPLGSWTLQEMLNGFGIKISLSSVGRLLKRMDSLEYTYLVNGQGRMITEAGSRYYQEKKADIHRSNLNNRLIDSVHVDSIKTMINLFNARIMIEKEIVRLAAQMGKPSDFEYLIEIVNEADANKNDHDLVTRLNRKFHIEIAKITNNPFLITMIDILMDKQWGLEAENTEVVEGYQNTICSRYHIMIVNAMIEGGGDTAADLMESHLKSLSMDAVNSIEFKSSGKGRDTV